MSVGMNETAISKVSSDAEGGKGGRGRRWRRRGPNYNFICSRTIHKYNSGTKLTPWLVKMSVGRRDRPIRAEATSACFKKLNKSC